MTDANTWVCGNCRSINPARSDRCYSCRSPRSLALDTSAAAPPKPILDNSPLEDRAAIARQAGATYQPTGPLAWVVRLAVVAVTIATLGMVLFDIWALRQAPSPELDEQLFWLTPFVLAGVGAAWLAGFVAWGAWLSRVVANVPALGGGWTGTSPTAAFISAVVPVSNLVWGTAVLRDAIVRLSPPDGARLWLLTRWWIVLVVAVLPWVGSLPQAGAVRLVFRLVAASFAGMVTALSGAEVSSEEIVEVIAGMLVVAAAVLAVGLVDHVEDLQEARAAALPAASAAE